MSHAPLGLTITLRDEVGDEELDQLTRQLRDAIDELGVEEVRLAPGTGLPVGAKGDSVTLGSLVVTLASAGVFTGLVEVLKSWVLNRGGRTAHIKVKIEGQEIELDFPQPSDSHDVVRSVESLVEKLKKSG